MTFRIVSSFHMHAVSANFLPSPPEEMVPGMIFSPKRRGYAGKAIPLSRACAATVLLVLPASFQPD